MAAAVSSSEDRRPSRPLANSVNTRPLRQPSSPSSSTSISGGVTSRARPVVPAAAPSAESSGPVGGGGGGGGVWGSLLSLAAVAIPPSLLPFAAANGTSGGHPQEQQSPSQEEEPDREREREQAGSPRRSHAARVTRAPRSAIASTAASIASSTARRIASSNGGNRGSQSLLSLSVPSSSAARGSSSAGAPAGDGSTVQQAGNRMAGALGSRNERATGGRASSHASDAAASGGSAVGSGASGSPPVMRASSSRSAARSSRPEGAGSTASEVAPAQPAAAVSSAAVACKGKVYLEGGGSVYTCSTCRAHLATRDHVVSELFHGHGGRAFLFERCVNVTTGKPENRLLLTGMHVVADISCSSCGTELGWKYEEAAKETQKYKEGKFILERCAVTTEGCQGDGYSSGWGSLWSNDCYGADEVSRYCGFGDERFGSDGGFMGWGADSAPYAAGGRW